jgi:hypothetical protein
MKKIYTKSVILFTGALLFSSSLFAQVTKNLAVNNFNKVSVSSGIDLYLTQGATESAKVVGDKELVDKIVLEKNGTTLNIKYRDNTKWSGMFRSRTSIKVYLNLKTLNELSASGGSDVYGQNAIKTDRLALSTSGGSDVELNLVCKDITIKASGGSDLDLKGSATNMDLNISGGSDVDAEDFSVDYAKVHASGGSDAEIRVNKALEADASGGSDVRFHGDAAYKKTSSSRSGSVKRIN